MKPSNDALFQAVLWRAAPVAAAVVEFSGGLGSWMQRLYTASEGGGATCNDCALNVTQTSNLGQSLLVTGFGYDHGAPWQTNMELFKELTDASRGVRRLGAAAVPAWDVAQSHVARKYAMLAAGGSVPCCSRHVRCILGISAEALGLCSWSTAST